MRGNGHEDEIPLLKTFSVDEFRVESGDMSEWFLAGWAFVADQVVCRVVADIGGQKIPISYGWERSDVLKAFPGVCPSKYVGFHAFVIFDCDLPPGGHVLNIAFFNDEDLKIGCVPVAFETTCTLHSWNPPIPDPEKISNHPGASYLNLLEKTVLGLPYAVGRELTLRRGGLDWPEFAHTMIGGERLGHLRACAETVLQEKVPGDFMETGVWRGGACILLRGILKAFDVKDRRVWLADSFAGLPKPDPEKYPADQGSVFHSYPELAIPLDQVRENFRRYDLLDNQVMFLKGLFSETLPSAPVGKLALLRLDGDMYESTMDALTWLYPKLSPGGYCIIDDYGAIPPCRQAVRDYRKAHGICEKISMIDSTGAWWKKAVPQ
jgi:O-methyltransferase